MGSVRVARSIGTELLPSLQQTKGHRDMSATSSPISVTSEVKALSFPTPALALGTVWFVSQFYRKCFLEEPQHEKC